LPTAEVITGHVPVTAVCDDTGLSAKVVPNRFTLAIFSGCALNLKSTGGYSPDKIRRKLQPKIGRYHRIHFLVPVVNPLKNHLNENMQVQIKKASLASQ